VSDESHLVIPGQNFDLIQGEQVAHYVSPDEPPTFHIENAEVFRFRLVLAAHLLGFFPGQMDRKKLDRDTNPRGGDLAARLGIFIQGSLRGQAM